MSHCKNSIKAIRAVPGTVQNLILYTGARSVVGNVLSSPLSGWMAGRYDFGEAGDGEDGASRAGGHWGRCELRGAWRDSSGY